MRVPPPPEQVIWTNLEYGWDVRTKEQIIALGTTVCLIALSFTVALMFNVTDRSWESEYEVPMDDDVDDNDDDSQGAFKFSKKQRRVWRGYVRAFMFAAWIQVYDIIVVRVFAIVTHTHTHTHTHS